jgi:hypothetical protein
MSCSVTSLHKGWGRLTQGRTVAKPLPEIGVGRADMAAPPTPIGMVEQILARRARG